MKNYKYALSNNLFLLRNFVEYHSCPIVLGEFTLS